MRGTGEVAATAAAALTWDDAVDEILARTGRRFDPSIVELFVAGQRDLRAVYEDLRLVA